MSPTPPGRAHVLAQNCPMSWSLVMQCRTQRVEGIFLLSGATLCSGHNFVFRSWLERTVHVRIPESMSLRTADQKTQQGMCVAAVTKKGKWTPGLGLRQPDPHAPHTPILAPWSCFPGPSQPSCQFSFFPIPSSTKPSSVAVRG